jgi:glycogen(starch) synthase
VRVLTVGNMYPPHHLGGYELVWRSAVRHLRSRGHEVRVLTTDFRLRDPAGDEDPDVHRELRWWWHDHAFPRYGLRERFARERHNAHVLGRHLEQDRPDVVSWWAMGGMSLSLIERVRRLGLPAVAFVHDDWLDYGPRADAWLRLYASRPAIGRAVAALTRMPTTVRFRDAARYLFVSERTRQRALSVHSELASTAIAHSGIDPAYLDPQPERDWEWRLLYVGRLEARKGVATAVAALVDLPAEATLTLVGADAGLEGDLRAQIAALGLGERVRLTGPLARDALRAAYAAADVVVFPVTWDEPWGLVPLEAMALGRPVVATGRGGSAEYLRDGGNALLFEAGDPTALAAAVERLADDAGLRARLRAAGLATAPAYTEDVFNATVSDELERAARA